MKETHDQNNQDEQPTYETIAEERFIADVHAMLEAWREAGKPHKR